MLDLPGKMCHSLFLPHKNQSQPERPLPLKWECDPNLPIDDFFQGNSPDDAWSEALKNFIFLMETGDFRAWEAVLAQEQGLPLTRQQQAALNDLVSFHDSDDDQVLYINEIVRPSQPVGASVASGRALS